MPVVWNSLPTELRSTSSVSRDTVKSIEVPLTCRSLWKDENWNAITYVCDPQI